MFLSFIGIIINRHLFCEYNKCDDEVNSHFINFNITFFMFIDINWQFEKEFDWFFKMIRLTIHIWYCRIVLPIDKSYII